MQTKLEREITTDVLKALREAGAWAEKVHGGPMQSRGLPDIFAVYKGQAYGIEVKRPGEKATQIQLYVLGRMELAGAKTGVVHDVPETLTLLGVN